MSPMLRVFRTRTAAVVFAAAVLADWWSLPEGSVLGAPLVVSYCLRPGYAKWAISTPGGIQFADTDSEPETSLGLVVFSVQRGDYGLWAPTRHIDIQRIVLSAIIGPQAAVRSAFAEHLASEGLTASAGRLASADQIQTSIIWTGYLHNAGALLALFGACYALSHRGSWKPMSSTPADRRAATLSTGKCPTCGYSISGLPPLAPCPECGDWLSPDR